MTSLLAHDSCDEFVFPLADVEFHSVIHWPTRLREPRVRRKKCAEAIERRDLHATFKELVESWRTQTWYVSSLKRRTSHPDYLKILGMGMPAVPWILQELRETPDHWFTALEAITREDPDPTAQNMHQLRDAWLAWGERHGC